MRTSDFHFELPEALIAQRPPPSRTDSRMMVVDCARGVIDHHGIRDLPHYLQPEDVLVLNDTRVMPARLFGQWDDTGGALELLLVEELFEGMWDCMHRTRRKLAPGQAFTSRGGRIKGHVQGIGDAGRIHIQFLGDPDFATALEAEGIPPVPPYIARQMSDDELLALDQERYQTVFAREPGAVAAPTAGLHFSDALLDEIRARGTKTAYVTLHVGPGTFKPVKVDQVDAHVMDAERYVISQAAVQTIADARAQQGRVVAVGTTGVRTLESACAEHGALQACEGESRLFIYPPYAFKSVDALLTNFHLPESTLLMLVAAFAQYRMSQELPDPHDDAGRALIMRAYEEAIRESYRFYSYGDCMLLV